LLASTVKSSGEVRVPTSELDKAIGRLEKSYALLRDDASKHFADWAAVRSAGDRVEFAEAIETENWRALDKAAHDRLAEHRKTLRDMLAERGRVKKQVVVGRQAEGVLEEHFVAPRTRPDWAQLRTGVEQELRSRGRSEAQVKRAIGRLSRLDSDDVVRPHKAAITSYMTELDQYARSCLPALIGAELAAAVARFNLDARRRSRTTPAVSKRDLRTTEQQIRRAQKGFYGDLAAGRFPEIDLPAGRQLDSRLLDALAAAAQLSSARNPKRTKSEAQLALRVGTLIRALLRHQAIRYVIAWIGSGEADSRLASEWLRSPAGRTFDSGWTPPAARKIADLAANPTGVAVGTPLTVEGSLGAVTIEHLADVPVSRAALRGSGGGEIWLTTKHRKADSAGMVEGCWVRASGLWVHDAPGAGGPALEISRVPYRELSSTSWSDWLTAELRRVYEPSTQGMATEWSWEAGRDGAGNQLRYKVWFAPERRGG
jgi:hypothetical protein